MSREPALSAAAYASWRRSVLGEVTERLEMRLVTSLAAPVEGRRVLDAGTGDGAYALAFAARGARVTAVDRELGMLVAARARAPELGRGVAWCQASLEALPFDDGAFDLVSAVTVCCFVRDPVRAVRELARVLVPGGRLVLGELGRHSALATWRRARGWLGSATWRHARFWSRAELGRLLESAGLRPSVVRGAVYYPPLGVAARAFEVADPLLGRLRALGAAFLAVLGRKP